MQKGFKDIIFFPVFNPGEMMKAPHRTNYFGLLPSSPAPQAEGLLALKEKEIELKILLPCPFHSTVRVILC